MQKFLKTRLKWYLMFVVASLVFICALKHKNHQNLKNETRYILNFKQSKRKFCPFHKFPNQQPRDRVNSTDKLQEMRNEMKQILRLQIAPLQGYIVTVDDEHQSDFLSKQDQRLKYISGFSGTIGTALITKDEAILWTNDIFFIQADSQLDCNWILVDESRENAPTLEDWLKNEFRDTKACIGADPKLIPAVIWDSWEAALASPNIKLIAIETNLVDKIWQKDRSEYKNYLAYPLEIKYSGIPWQEKVKKVRNEILLINASALVVTALDEIAWLLNIRAHDFSNTRVLRAYVIVSLDKIRLYTSAQKLDWKVKDHLKMNDCHHTDCVLLSEYSAIFKDLKTFNRLWNLVWLPSSCNEALGASKLIYSCISKEKRLIRPSPIINLRAEKNEIEIKGMRNAHLKDAVALCDFLAYLEEQIELNAVSWDELQIARVVNSFRLEQNDSEGISFETVVGYGPHGAIPHYKPTNLTNVKIEFDSTLVIDSGGQYRDGTTDVTRTLFFGKVPNQEQKEAYTNVLIGQIELATAIFPNSIRTDQLDVLARKALWKKGSDYKHGTSHGIGHFLSVHEPPIAGNGEIVPGCNSAHLRPGYFLSNEPGFYKEGDFGVRLENIIEVVQADFPNSWGGPFLTFRDVTLVPYEPKLIEVEMLTAEHRRWLNSYNKRIRNEVGNEMKNQLRSKGYWWMIKKTRGIPEQGPVNLNSFQGIS